MASEKDRDDPSTTSYAYDQMVHRWQLIDTLLGGTVAMRNAGEEYLPRHEEETYQGYESRLNQTVLYNMVEQNLDALSGKPFTDDIKVNEDVPAAIQENILEDVDLQGNNLTVFCRQWFREGFAKAFSHVLVDFPRAEPTYNGQPRSLEDERKQGRRPYWVHIKPENLIFASSEIRNGAEFLTHVRIFECTLEQDGFAQVERRRIRVLEPGKVMMYQPVKSNKPGKDEEWQLEDEWETGLSYIPLVTFYADRQDLMLGKPPLEDLAWLNVTHWQSSSDQRNILRIARFPILACSGASEDDKPVVVGPNKVLYNPDPQGKFYYVEHNGNAIKAGMEDLKALEDQMSGYGAEFLKKRPGHLTATARALDSAEATSDLQAMAGVFEDAVEQCLDITADWMKLNSEGGSIEVVKDYSMEEFDRYNYQALSEARTKRDISRLAYVTGLKLRGVLTEDFDPEEDAERLAEENATLFNGSSNLNLDPGAPPTPPPGQGSGSQNEPPGDKELPEGQEPGEEDKDAGAI